MLVELGDRLRVVDLELGVGDLVDPGANRLAEQLATGLAADRVGNCADGISWIDEAERHGTTRNVEGMVDGKTWLAEPQFAGGWEALWSAAGRAADPHKVGGCR